MKFCKIAMPILAIALVSMLILSGCGGGNSENRAGIQLYLADDPIDAKEVNVTISQVAVSQDGEGWTTLRNYGADGLTINLLDYRYDGDELTADQYLLADTPLTEGHYTQIRLILTKVELKDNDDVIHEVEMSSQDQTGLKLIGEFDVEAGTKTAVLIDFNVAKSVVREGNGDYRLHPTVKVVPLQISGSLHGVVQFKDAAGTADVEMPEGATISAYQGDTLAASALIMKQEDGTYTFGMNGLVAGQYTLKLETPGFTATDVVVTVTAKEDTDAGTVVATQVPAQ